jgi:predicted HicB family RNase H-like nuclease
MKKQAIKIMVRIPPDMKSWLEHEAARLWTSQNAEVIRAIRSRMDQEQPGKAVG